MGEKEKEKEKNDLSTCVASPQVIMINRRKVRRRLVTNEIDGQR